MKVNEYRKHLEAKNSRPPEPSRGEFPDWFKELKDPVTGKTNAQKTARFAADYQKELASQRFN